MVRRGRIGRWADELLALMNEYESDVDPMNIWEAHIANRNFEAAEGLLSEISDEVRGSANYLSDQTISQVINYWFLGDGDRLDDIVDEARRGLDSSRDAEGNIPAQSWNYYLALLAAVEGNAEESERLSRRWLRGETDLASLHFYRHTACQVLGMADATSAAVKCIRDLLDDVSLVFPLLEPFLPYYDSIRDKPEFIELLAEIDIAASSR